MGKSGHRNQYSVDEAKLQNYFELRSESQRLDDNDNQSVDHINDNFELFNLMRPRKFSESINLKSQATDHSFQRAIKQKLTSKYLQRIQQPIKIPKRKTLNESAIGIGQVEHHRKQSSIISFQNSNHNVEQGHNNQGLGSNASNGSHLQLYNKPIKSDFNITGSRLSRN